MTAQISVEDRFFGKVEKTSTCWWWRGAADRKLGYGNFYRHGKTVCAHRVAYELLVGSIPAGRVLDHICRNPACVNPAHLRLCTQRENILSGKAPTMVTRRLGRCARGHVVARDNTYYRPNGRGECRACRRLRDGSTKVAARLRTHCPRGHPYDEMNTRWYQGRRYCKECNGINQRERMKRNPEVRRRRNAQTRAWQKRNRERRNAIQRAYMKRKKLNVPSSA